jgi:hypothetical protein
MSTSDGPFQLRHGEVEILRARVEVAVGVEDMHCRSGDDGMTGHG